MMDERVINSFCTKFSEVSCYLEYSYFSCNTYSYISVVIHILLTITFIQAK